MEVWEDFSTYLYGNLTEGGWDQKNLARRLILSYSLPPFMNMIKITKTCNVFAFAV